MASVRPLVAFLGGRNVVIPAAPYDTLVLLLSVGDEVPCPIRDCKKAVAVRVAVLGRGRRVLSLAVANNYVGYPADVKPEKPPLAASALPRLEAGAGACLIDAADSCLMRYMLGLVRRYRVRSSPSIFSSVVLPGRGGLLGERFSVYLVEGDYLQVETPWGVDFALNFVLGTYQGRWVLMGTDGLYEGVFVKKEGAGGKVGYVEVVKPFEKDVRLVEGPQFFCAGGVLPSAKSTLVKKCGVGRFWAAGRCLEDREAFRIATRWPVERYQGPYSERLVQLLAGGKA